MGILQNKLKQDYDVVFSSEAGQRVLADLYNFCGIKKQMFNPNPYETAHNTGKHRVMQRIQMQMHHDDQKAMEISDLKTLNITKRS